MRIGLARRGFSGVGGAEHYLARLMDGLRAHGHEPVLFADASWADVPVNGRTPRAFADALRALEPKTRCDALLSLERVWECDVYRAGDGVHRAWLDRRRAIEPSWRGPLRSWNLKHRQLLELEETLFARGGAKRVIANSRLVRDEIVRIYGCPAERIAVVYNGLDGPPPPSEIERRDARQKLSWDESKYIALFVGSGWERKGLPQAIAAARQASGLELVVAGRGPAGEGARFLGPIDDLRRIYAAADFFVLPTLYDPFSNACLEALAAGLPVITTRANGFSEIIEPGEEGEALDDPLDIGALATSLRAWMDRDRLNAARRVCLAKAAQYPMERNLSQTVALLQK